MPRVRGAAGGIRVRRDGGRLEPRGGPGLWGGGGVVAPGRPVGPPPPPPPGSLGVFEGISGLWGWSGGASLAWAVFFGPRG